MLLVNKIVVIEWDTGTQYITDIGTYLEQCQNCNRDLH